MTDTAPSYLLLRGTRPGGGAPRDVLVRDGLIAEIGTGLESPDGGEVIDAEGGILLPGLVDAHAHLDTTLWGLPWRPHSAPPAPTLAQLIDNDHRVRGELPPVAERAGRLLARYVECGASHVRSHVHVDPELGLDGVEGVFEARDAFAGRIEVETVAFPQCGLVARPGTREVMEAAVRAGVENVGGLDPAGFDGDPVGHLDAVFGIAERHGCGVDIHLHDGGELGAWEIQLIMERTRGTGLQGRVTISHAFALGTVGEPLLSRLIEGLAEHRISIATVAPGARAVPPLHRLRDAGVTVGLGSDGIRDTWGPFGDGDMLERAMLLAYRCGFRRDEDLELALDVATHGGAQALGLERYGLEVGCRADLVVVPGDSAAEAVVSRPPRAIVIHGGRRVA